MHGAVQFHRKEGPNAPITFKIGLIIRIKSRGGAGKISDPIIRIHPFETGPPGMDFYG
jgi:hypothetical protein